MLDALPCSQGNVVCANAPGRIKTKGPSDVTLHRAYRNVKIALFPGFLRASGKKCVASLS